MLRTYLNGKIHLATITDANRDYEGSLTLDMDLADAAGFQAYEKVLVANLENGNRFETYIIEGKRGSGTVCVNGAAALLVTPGDKIIVMTFTQLTPEQAKTHKPTILKVNSRNEPL